MTFYEDGDVIKVMRITGPTHNLLTLKLGANPDPSQVDVEELHIPGPINLDALQVMQQVCAGISDANSELNVNLSFSRLQFVPSDSKPVSIYREMARALVRHYVQKIAH